MGFFNRLKAPRKTFINDIVTGLVMSIVTVPGALANGLLAGVNPVYGVYSVIAGTSVAAIFLPLQFAVATGVIFTVILYVFRSAEKVRVERITPLDDGGFAEETAPETVPSGEILILQPVGSLFFAGVAEFEDALPGVGDASGAVVIIRLRDRDEVGSTFIRLVERYARTLEAADNLLMLEGLSTHVLEQLEKTKIVDLIGRENIFLAQPRFGASLNQAMAAAEKWIGQDSHLTVRSGADNR